MITIVSSDARERGAFAAICETHGWAAVECESLRAFQRACEQLVPAVVLARHKLSDGYADDIMSWLARNPRHGAARVMVLLNAGAPTNLEARQIALGASCVLRDPIRPEVLLAYLARFGRERRRRRDDQACPDAPFEFAGATVHPIERRIESGGRTTTVTPREMELIKLLGEAHGRVITYQTLYSEMLGRRFRGETSNMRVLLGRLVRSFAAVGLSLRRHLQVIPKTGYRYSAEPRPATAAQTRASNP